MLAAFLILLREGLEAVLVITVIAMFLTKMGHSNLFKPMWIGVGIAVVICVGLGVTLHAVRQELPETAQEAMEGTIGIAACIILTWMIFWMRKAGRKIKGEVETKLNAALTSPRNNAAAVLISMAFFAVLREGIESVLFLFSVQQSNSFAGLAGGLLGLALAVGFGLGLYQGTTKLNISKVFHWTSIFIIFFASGLFASAIHAFREIHVIDFLTSTAWNTSRFVDQGTVVGTLARSLFGYRDSPAIIEVVAYFAFLVPVLGIFLLTSPNKHKSPNAITQNDPAEVAVSALTD